MFTSSIRSSLSSEQNPEEPLFQTTTIEWDPDPDDPVNYHPLKAAVTVDIAEILKPYAVSLP
jgi:hypothetical protein